MNGNPNLLPNVSTLRTHLYDYLATTTTHQRRSSIHFFHGFVNINVKKRVKIGYFHGYQTVIRAN